MLLRIVKLGAIAETFALSCGNDALPRRMAERLPAIRGRAHEIRLRGGRAVGVVVDRDGALESIEASAVVSAVPAPRAAELLRGDRALAESLARIPYSDIVLAHLHLDRPLPDPAFTYVFSRSDGRSAAFAIDAKRKCPWAIDGDRSILQLHFPSPLARELLSATDGEVLARAVEDARTFFPDIRSWIVDSDVHRRPEAVPSFECGVFRRIRAAEREAGRIEGLQLAGDYLRAPLAEGAARSGLAAAERIARAPRASGE